MSFLSGIFLWALPLAAVPVIVHLLNRRRREVVRWGAMQLLLDSVPRKRRIWRINDILLMLLRVAAVAAIVLAFARPQLRSGILTGKAPGRDVILVVDSSLSTGRLQGGVPVFDQIKRKAGEFLERLGSTDRVRVMIAASAPLWLGEGVASGQQMTRQEASTLVAGLKPTLATADMPACVQSALSAEPPADATGRLIVIATDGSAHGWSADVASRWQSIHELAAHAALPTTINVVTADVPKSPLANLSVETIVTNRTRVAAGEPFTLTARIRNVGDVSREATILKWEIDGQTSGESPVTPLEPGQSIEVAYETSCDQTGVYSFSGRLGAADDLPGDNSASIVMESLERLPILICRDEKDLDRPKSRPDFLMAALGRVPESSRGDYSTVVFEPTLIGIDALSGTDLTIYRCVVLDDVLPKSSDVVDRLSDFAGKGGGVWLILGENVTAEQFNGLVFRDGAGLVPIAIGQRAKADERTEFFTIHPPEGTHPATVLLGDTERLDIDDVRIKQFWQLSTGEATDDVATLLETGDGAPLAVEHFAGDGRIIVQALPADAAWSNLPVCQAFVPLVQEWIWYLTQPTAAKYNVDPGGPIVLAAASAEGRKEAAVVTALGEKVPLSLDSSGRKEFRYRETAFPGDYRVTVAAAEGPGRRVPFSVRRDPEESRLAPLSTEQTAALSQGGGLRFGGDPLSFPDSLVQAVRYQPFWNYLLGLIALLFVAEFVCAYLLTNRRYATATQSAQFVLGGSNERSDWGRGSAS